MTRKCMWCDEEFKFRCSGGKEQKYCSEQCRIEFHRKLRQWALEKFQSGSITKEELQRVHSKTILTEGLN